MSTFYDTVIRIISKPSEERGSEEINLILAWFLNLFKRKSAVFGDIKPDVIKDIIKNCSFETKNPDDIIIKQGDVGDCFYINLRGKVSIYINHQKHDVQDAVENESVPTSNNSDELNERSLNGFDDSLTSSSWTSASNPSSSKSKKLRERLGNYVTSLGPGEGFGEIALVRDELRTASIIADEKTDLMVVNKTLYSRCLQATALRKLNEKQEFINKSPFFGNWQPKMKKLLSLCLERDIIPYDTYLGKQGEPADRMYFIISGQAKLIVNPSAHKNQYPRFYPLKLPENESQDYVNSLIESKHSPRYNVHTNNSITNAVLKRRNETFAEAEQRRKNRQIELGILGPGEISGMCELVFDMPTYMQSTRCLESCDVFYIFRRSYERLIAKRNPNCIGKMKSNVLVKLSARNARLPIDLFRSIEYTIRLQMRSTTTTTPSSSNNIVAKSSTSTVSGIVGANNTGSSSMSSASSMSSPRVITAHQGSNILPQRGALVQLDSHTYMQSKSKLLNRARQQHLREKQKKHEEKLEQQKKIMRLYRSGVDLEEDEDDNDSEQKEPNSNENNGVRTTYHPIMIGPNNNIVIMNAGVDLKSLEELEDKMKKWQLDLGCKKAFVTKMNRVELSVDASKKSIVKTRAMTMPSAATSTTTGQTWAQPIRGSAARSQHDSNVKNRRERQLPAASRNKTNSMLLSRSSSSSSMSIDMDNSSDASTTVNSSSGDSNETGATRSTLALRRRGYNYVRGHEAPPASSLDFNANKLLSFASQSIGNNTSNNTMSTNHHRHQLFAESAQTFLHSILTNMSGMGDGATTTSLPPLVMLNEFASTTFAPEFPTWSNSSSNSAFLEPSQSQSHLQIQPQSKEHVEVRLIADEEDEDTDDMTQLNSNKPSKNDQQTNGGCGKKPRSNSYYFVKRKFSMSQVKIQANGGRQYSKEEYLALKDELKRQMRRSSIPAAF